MRHRRGLAIGGLEAVFLAVCLVCFVGCEEDGSGGAPENHEDNGEEESQDHGDDAEDAGGEDPLTVAAALTGTWNGTADGGNCEMWLVCDDGPDVIGSLYWTGILYRADGHIVPAANADGTRVTLNLDGGDGWSLVVDGATLAGTAEKLAGIDETYLVDFGKTSSERPELPSPPPPAGDWTPYAGHWEGTGQVSGHERTVKVYVSAWGGKLWAWDSDNGDRGSVSWDESHWIRLGTGYDVVIFNTPDTGEYVLGGAGFPITKQ